jgi:hypothetical protein
MKIANIMAVAVVGSLISFSTLQAAPVESVDSAVASPARQKVVSYLNEKAVVAQLNKLGVSADQIQSRLATLNDAQLAQMASQVDKIHSAGDIQGGDPHPLGPLECILKDISCTVKHVIKLLFCWTDVEGV